MSFSVNTQNKRIQFYDLLRGLAILLVLLYHLYTGDFSLGIKERLFASKVADSYFYGVLLFFILSGSIITLKYYDWITQLDNVPISRKVFHFFSRRMTKIVPSLFFWLICNLLTYHYFFTNKTYWHDLQNLISATLASIFFYYNFFFTEFNFLIVWHWSLATEEQFYLFYIFMLTFIKKNKTRAITLFLILLGTTFITRILIYSELDFDAKMFAAQIHYPQNTIDIFIWGIFTSLFFKNIKMPKLSPRTYNLLCHIMIITALVVPFITGYNLGLVIFCLLFSSVIVVNLKELTFFTYGTLPDKALLWLGTRSYSIYLCHQFVLNLIRKHHYYFPKFYSLNLFWISFTVSVCLTIIFSELGYQVLEIRFKSYLDRKFKSMFNLVINRN